MTKYEEMMMKEAEEGGLKLGWHSLWKNPNDLPPHKHQVLLYVKLREKWRGAIAVVGYRINETWLYVKPACDDRFNDNCDFEQAICDSTFNNDEEVVAWCEIPEFGVSYQSYEKQMDWLYTEN